ncbi:TonB-dependent receptor plug domain-containing protein [Thiomicrospira pelophila]|uniref:TonB-dependent receptor plug domain-containing protein n=1 Tax=Thiomicrospira pelophila TaxID=934 RepID=UPI0004A6A905|nr:TonB-dependent receptor [Thiomicrospira pelophila]
MLKYRLITLSLSVAILPFQLHANDSDEQAYQELMALLNAQTELVTRTKVNADYVPGSISVLRGTELMRYGVRTVKDALSMTTSIEVQPNHLGQSVLVMRGLGTPYSGGTVKLMLDNVNMVNSSAGYSEGILHMPIEQVERIEVIRGAASVLHGDFAYSGVVNVISKKDRHFSVGVGSRAYNHVSASEQFESGSKQSQLSLSFSQWQQDKSGRRVEGDVLTEADPLIAGGALDLASYSQAPGLVNDRKAFRNLLVNLSHNDTEFYWQTQEYQTGDYFGFIEFLPKETQDYNQRYRDMLLGVRQSSDLTPGWNYEWHLGAQQKNYQLKTLYTSEDISFMQPDPDVGFLAHQSPIESYLTERVLNLSGHLVYDANSQHRALLGADVERVEIIKLTSDSILGNENPDDDIQKDLEQGSEGDLRLVFAVYVQDEWRPNDQFTLTTGVRAQKAFIGYQDRTEADPQTNPFEKLEELNITPKIAGVWRLTDQHIIKAQFSRSLITPPIGQVTDVGGAPNPKPYVSETDHYELGYIFQGLKQTHRFTGFYSDYNNMPRGSVYFGYFDGDYSAEPFKNVISKGVEWDTEFNLAQDLIGFANASWLDTKDVDNDVRLVGSTDRMAALGLNYELNSQWRMTVWSKYIGERFREPYDGRENLKPYSVTNLTASYASETFKGLIFRLGVENLADTDQRYASPINGTLSDLAGADKYLAAYQADYPGTGRQFWAKMQYEF